MSVAGGEDLFEAHRPAEEIEGASDGDIEASLSQGAKRVKIRKTSDAAGVCDRETVHLRQNFHDTCFNTGLFSFCVRCVDEKLAAV